MLTIYHNPRCRKSRETLQIIEDAGATVQVVEYLKTTPSKETLTEIVDKLDIKPEQLIRKGEKAYKENYKGKTLTDAEWLEAMEKHPKLIERPIVVKDDQAVIGRPPENVKQLL
ncbi:MAG: arsenate reductase (glutaredoxin) [Fulvivirga sp.]|nr:arsenate reductase (glutaredoxin) [Fulvivirga sp.]